MSARVLEIELRAHTVLNSFLRTIHGKWVLFCSEALYRKLKELKKTTIDNVCRNSSSELLLR